MVLDDQRQHDSGMIWKKLGDCLSFRVYLREWEHAVSEEVMINMFRNRFHLDRSIWMSHRPLFFLLPPLFVSLCLSASFAIFYSLDDLQQIRFEDNRREDVKNKETTQAERMRRKTMTNNKKGEKDMREKSSKSWIVRRRLWLAKTGRSSSFHLIAKPWSLKDESAVLFDIFNFFFIQSQASSNRCGNRILPE